MNNNKLKNSFNLFTTALILLIATLLLTSQAIAAGKFSHVTLNFHGTPKDWASQVTFNFPEISKNGKLYLIVVKNEDAYKEENPNIADIVFQAVVEVTGKSFSINAGGFSPGTYAAKFFLDTNRNGKLDINADGIPTEPYGFSNNKKGLSGPPDFEEVTFSVKAGKATVQNVKFF